MFTNSTNIKGLVVVSFLACSLTTSLSYADWSGQQQFRGYNPGYGDFPPDNIEQQLFSDLNQGNKEQNTQAKAEVPATTVSQYSGQDPNQAAYQEFLRKREQHASERQQHTSMGNQRYNRQTNYNRPQNNNSSNFSMPFGNDNRGSSFSMPFGNNNRGSNFSGPWNNNQSSMSGPWDNRGGNFSSPMNNGSRNNGGNFSMPWGNNNNGSNFSPMGNGGGWSW